MTTTDNDQKQKIMFVTTSSWGNMKGTFNTLKEIQ